MPAFPHIAPAADLPLAVLLAQDELRTRLTLLALEAVGDPSASTRVLNLLEDLSALVEICEEQAGLVMPLGSQRVFPMPLGHHPLP